MRVLERFVDQCLQPVLTKFHLCDGVLHLPETPRELHILIRQRGHSRGKSGENGSQPYQQRITLHARESIGDGDEAKGFLRRLAPGLAASYNRCMSTRIAVRAFVLSGLLLSPPTRAAGPQVLEPGHPPQDQRLGPLKDLNGYFPFHVPESREAWSRRTDRVRRQILVSLGLWPMPARTPLNAVIYGRRDQGDYTVEKVYFESAPGLFVAGNLYRPKGKSGRVPGVLCPHGHWDDGRFTDAGADQVRRDIAAGAERFEDGGRSPLQARCVTLARMGCVVFHYDMLGYADSQQLSMDLVHGFAKQRPAMNDPEHWGFFSPQAESRFESVMGLQAWDSIRALDFLESLPDIDSSRLAVTGASGGGTQTFILGAIDPRPAVAFPAVMVSTAMQGGCTCENACGLRVGTGNVEFAALFAPKPLGMTAANDWTVEMPTKGFPELRRLYEMLGARENVMLKAVPQFGHNYNYVSREAMYGWFNKHLALGLEEPVLETDYPRLTRSELTVWDDQHPRPQGGDDFERNILQWWTRDATDQLDRAAATPEGRRSLLQPAIDVVIGRTLSEVGPVEWDLKLKNDRGHYLEMAGLLRATDHGEVLPVVFLHPRDSRNIAVVWPTPTGKAGLYQNDGTPTAEVRDLLDQGTTVVGVDLFGQGEFTPDGKPLERTRTVNNPREAAAYTFGYNPTVFQYRVHDLLTVLSFIQHHEKAPDHLRLLAKPGAGAWAAAARSVSGGAVEDGGIQVGDFRFADIRDLHSPDFLPGGAKFLDRYVLTESR